MPVQGQKFVIVGGAGFVGSAVAHKLIGSHGANAIVCDTIGSLSDQKWSNLPSSLDDLWTPSTLLANLEKAWREISGVILLCDSGHHTKDGDALFETAYHLPRRVWDFCVTKQRPLFWASSAHVYGDGVSNLSRHSADIGALEPKTAFGVAKQAFDVFAAKQGTGPTTPPIWTGMRLSSVYGNGERHKGEQASMAVRAMAHAKAGTNLDLWENSLDQTRDWVHVDDAAAAISALVVGEHAGFFDIGTGIATSTRELIGHVETATGKALNLSLSHKKPSDLPISLAPADVSALQAVGISYPFRSLPQGLADL